MGMYFRTVRGETRTPSLTSSSWAILSSPHVMFATAISAINFFSSSGSVGRCAFYLFIRADPNLIGLRSAGTMPA